MEENYKIELSGLNIRFDNFKQKQSYVLRNIIENSRLQANLSFDSYAEIVFDENDKHLKFPEIIPIKEYNRNKTNCLIYNIKDNMSKYFDKMFVSQYIGNIHSYYDVVFYNSATNRVLHKYCINYDYSDLCITINKVFNGLVFFDNYNKNH